MNKSVVLNIGLVVMLAGSVFLVFNKTDDFQQGSLSSGDTQPVRVESPLFVGNEKTSAHEALSAIADPNPFINRLSDRLETLSQRTDMSRFALDDIKQALNNPEVWGATSSIPSQSLPLDDDEKVDGRAFFTGSQIRVAISLPGDVLEVSIPDSDKPFKLYVEQVNASGKGIVNFIGKLENRDGTFRMTQGTDFIAGHINTSSNTYSFEMFGNEGWVHESGALFTGEHPPVVDPGAEVDPNILGSNGESIVVNHAKPTVEQHDKTIDE